MVQRGLPDIPHTTDPAWFAGEDPATAGGWSLLCRFDPSPYVQGNPTVALVKYLSPHGPADRLRPSTRLRLFERWTRRFADVEILA